MITMSEKQLKLLLAISEIIKTKLLYNDHPAYLNFLNLENEVEQEAFSKGIDLG